MYRLFKYILLLIVALSAMLQAYGQSAMPDNVCVGTTKDYWVTETPGSTYIWKINDIEQPATGHLISVLWDVPGNYIITVQEESAGGCTGEIQTGAVFVANALPASVTIEASENPVCFGTGVLFTATTTNGATNPEFSWFVNGNLVVSGNENTYTYVPEDGDKVYAVLDSDESCSIHQELILMVNPLPEVSISATETLCAGILHTLDAGSGFADYLWHDGSDLQNFEASDPGIYSVKVTNSNGCEATASVELIQCMLEIYLPNAFSPNGDNTNDTLIRLFRARLFLQNLRCKFITAGGNWFIRTMNTMSDGTGTTMEHRLHRECTPISLFLKFPDIFRQLLKAR